MVTLPGARPLIAGCVAGALVPAGMNAVAAERDAMLASLLVNATVTPPAGAFEDNVTWSGVDCPIPILAPPGRTTVPNNTTVTPALVPTILGAPGVAVIVAEPT